MASRRKPALLIAATLALALLAIVVYPLLWGRPFSIHHFFLRATLERVIQSPQWLSNLRLLEPWGLTGHNDDLDDVSLAHREKLARLYESQLAILDGYDIWKLTPEDRVSASVLRWQLERGIKSNRDWVLHPYAIEQLSSPHARLPDFLISIHAIANADDAENYITRVRKIHAVLDETIEVAKLQEQKGIIAPKFILEKVRADIIEFTRPDPDRHPLYLDLAAKLEKLPKFDKAKATQLRDQLAAVIKDALYPAYGRYQVMVEHLITKATLDAGVSRLPDGAAYYAFRLAENTTTTLTADEIFTIGNDMIINLRDEMRAIVAAQGEPDEDLSVAIDRIARRDDQKYPANEAGRAQALTDYEAIIAEAWKLSAEHFDLRPKSEVKVEAVPTFRERSSPGAYYQGPALDGSRPGVFYVNLKPQRMDPRFAMRTLAIHEAVPGHHFQVALAREMTTLPLFRRITGFNAYAEGWALYAERLADEQGFHKTPLDRLGYLQAQMWRAMRLVVDTSIHAKGMDRHAAVFLLRNFTGMSLHEAEAEIDRYIVWPGQACGYMVGQQRILAMRERAREKLGGRFDLKAFHRFILTMGPVPLTVLETEFDAWLANAGVLPTP